MGFGRFLIALPSFFCSLWQIVSSLVKPAALLRLRVRLGAIFLTVFLTIWLGWGAIAPPALALQRQKVTTPIARTTSSIQPYLDKVAEAVTEFTLDNGMKFIVLE
ncbi:MAG: hypothetical protein DCF15_21225, partial [Phormidesmis priestleyi]